MESGDLPTDIAGVADVSLNLSRTTDPVRAGIMEKWAFLRSAEKWFLASKWVLPQKITQNDISPLDYLGKGTFFL